MPKLKDRFEIFKRDNFTCQYCGKTPPEVVLEIDHIIPKSKKGKDFPENKITACFECNRGKSNILLTDKQAKGKIKENLELLKEREIQLTEYNKILANQQRKITRSIKKICNLWTELCDDEYSLNHNGQSDLRNLLNKFTEQEIIKAMYIAVKIRDVEGRFKYMCGILHNWRKTKQQEQWLNNEL